MIKCSEYEGQRRLNLEIEYSGHAVLDSEWHTDSECSPFSWLYYVKSGDGYLKHNGNVVKLRGGNVYLIPAECEFAYGCTQLEKMFFHISLTTTEQYELLSGIKRICSAPFSDKEYDDLYRCYFSDSYVDFLSLKTILYKTAAEFAEQEKAGQMCIRRYSDIVEKCMHRVQENVKINLTVKQLAHELYVSESFLRNSFRAETGITLGKYIDEIVFGQAKKLLAKKQMTLEAISRELGFCDRFYFSRRFTQKCGKTPFAYRRECGNVENDTAK